MISTASIDMKLNYGYLENCDHFLFYVYNHSVDVKSFWIFLKSSSLDTMRSYICTCIYVNYLFAAKQMWPGLTMEVSIGFLEKPLKMGIETSL